MIIQAKQSYSEDQRAALIKRALDRDQSVIPDLIDAHIEFTYAVVNSWTRRFPNKKKDVVCSAFHGLVQGVTWAVEGKLIDENIKLYLATTIRRYIRDFLSKDFLIPIPRKEWRRRMEKEDIKSFTNRTTKYLELDHRITYIENAPVMIPLENNDLKLEVPVYDEPIEAMSDLFVRLQLTPIEIEIVSMRLDDYTMAEIGKAMNFTAPRIHQIIQKIKEKIPKLGVKINEHKITGTKICTKCGVEKSLSEFYRRTDSNVGFKSVCKGCYRS